MTARAGGATPALSRAVGLDLDAYRADHIDERIRRALEREGAGSVAALAHLVARDAGARTRFRRSIAVSVSALFRDPAQFELLERELLPSLLAAHRRVRLWSAGCADGAELYSLAILLERLGALERAFLLGSDVLEENVAAARAGVYDGAAVSAKLRGAVRWELRDLVRDGAPSGGWNLVVCRNVAIYLRPAAKQALYQTLLGALGPGGVLLLGRSERFADARTMGLVQIAPHAYRRAA